MKSILVQFLRKKQFQPMWEKLYHVSKIGMNHWGGASLNDSGEVDAIQYVYEKLKHLENVNVFDVGANKGDYALLINKVFKNKGLSIYSFEPSLYTYKTLVENTKSVKSINPINLGLGENPDKVTLYSSGNGSYIASVYNLANPISSFDEKYSEEIIITTIDSYCEKNNIKAIDFLKIDIEGHEFFALKGAINLIKNKKIRFIQFEFGECHIDSRTFFQDFYNLLEEDYKFYRLVSNGLRSISHYTTDLEAFGTANFFVELKNPPSNNI